MVLNFSLVDVDERSGPLEISAGSHRYPLPAAHQRILDGTAPLERLLMRKGDLLVRDLRTLHRGSPNLSSVDRPNVTLIVAADGPEGEGGKVGMSSVRPGALEGLGPTARRMLRAFS